MKVLHKYSDLRVTFEKRGERSPQIMVFFTKEEDIIDGRPCAITQTRTVGPQAGRPHVHICSICPKLKYSLSDLDHAPQLSANKKCPPHIFR